MSVIARRSAQIGALATQLSLMTRPQKLAWGGLAVLATLSSIIVVAGAPNVAQTLLQIGNDNQGAVSTANPAKPPYAMLVKDTALIDNGAPLAPEMKPEFATFTPTQAALWNETIPMVEGPNPAARPFLMKDTASDSYGRALDCLTAAIHYEAATESVDGKRAVAQVVLNRIRHPAFPKTVCGVVFQGAKLPTGCQFTFTCDGSLDRMPNPLAWKAARKVAAAALAGSVYAPVGLATHYHTRWVVPYWAESLAKIGDVGAHIFYRWGGGWGTPIAFNSAYGGNELDVAALYDLGQAPFATPRKQLASLTTGMLEPTPVQAPPEPLPAAVPELATSAAAVEAKPVPAAVAEAPLAPPTKHRPQHLAIPSFF